MGTNPTKAADNIYCKCRKEAAKWNDKLNSREGASELLGVSVSSLSDYELGITKFVPVDKVVLMADLYNAPELKNHFCVHDCPIGQCSMHQLEIAELDRVTLNVLSSFRKINEVRDTLMDITDDGIITDNEKPKLQEVLITLDSIVKRSQELRLWAEKNLK